MLLWTTAIAFPSLRLVLLQFLLRAAAAVISGKISRSSSLQLPVPQALPVLREPSVSPSACTPLRAAYLSSVSLPCLISPQMFQLLHPVIPEGSVPSHSSRPFLAHGMAFCHQHMASSSCLSVACCCRAPRVRVCLPLLTRGLLREGLLVRHLTWCLV